MEVERHRWEVAKLERDGLPTWAARTLLRIAEQLLRQAEDDLALLLKELH